MESHRGECEIGDTSTSVQSQKNCFVVNRSLLPIECLEEERAFRVMGPKVHSQGDRIVTTERFSILHATDANMKAEL